MGWYQVFHLPGGEIRNWRALFDTPLSKGFKGITQPFKLGSRQVWYWQCPINSKQEFDPADQKIFHYPL